ncbi:hypothetical protein H7827_16330 [Streptomyces sp. JH002]|uniref:hypothetical protein n=1 Tax=Streptomyces sp. JH002 TaxID=2763259 RepID=UPI003D807E1E
MTNLVPDARDELDAALRANGITLPSLGLDPMTMAAQNTRPLVNLGRCNVQTVELLTAALRRAAERQKSD